MKFSRRGFFKFSAGSAVGLGLSGLTLKGLSVLNERLSEEIYPPRGPESFGNSICQLCPGGCGLTVRRIGPRAVGIAGNRNSPVNQGGLCPVGVAALQYLYHPERLRQPLRKRGNSWEEVSWDAALEEIGARLREAADRGESERMVALAHPLDGVMRQTASTLLGHLGSRNLIELTGPGDGMEVAMRLMQGVSGAPAYDLASSAFVLSIECEVLEGWTSPVWDMKSFSQFRGKRPRGRLVHAGLRRSITATKADQWVQLRPGSAGAFALGIAYVLLSERMYDFEFVHALCEGFEDWRGADGRMHAGFRTRVLGGYPLNRVSELTDVPPEQILRVAREFGSTRPAVALAGRIDAFTPNAVLTALAVHSLNALVGSIDRRGGVLLQYPGPLPGDERASAPSAPLLAGARTRLRMGEDPLVSFADALRARTPYLPSAALLLETDPLFDSPDPEDFGRLLRQIPLIISVAPFLNLSARIADYVLPAAGFLESWVEQPTPPGVPFTYRGLTPPVVPPVGQSRPAGDILLALGRAVGAPVPAADCGSLIRNRLAGLYALRRGAVAGTVFDQLWQQLMEQSGWWAPTYENVEQMLEQMETKGGWWDSFYRYEDWPRVLPASGRFRFFLPELEALRTAESPAGEAALFPRYQAPAAAGAADAYPLRVVFFDPLAAASRLPSLPVIREIAGVHAQNNSGLWVEIGHHEAERLHLRSGDSVWVESPHASARAVARVAAGVAEGCVNVPRGVAGGGPWSAAFVPAAAGLAGGGGGAQEIWVRLRRA